jgi:hypothetical protein
VLPEGTSHAPSNRGTTVAPPKRNRVATADVDSDGDGDSDGDKNPRAPRSETDPERFEEFWAIYDKRRGRKAAVAKYRLALKKPGVTPDLLVSAAASYIEWQRSEGKHPQFTKDPATWLRGEHWNDVAAAFDNRKPDADQARAWAMALDGLRFEDCREAIVQHYRQSREWLMPVEVIAAVKKLRNARVIAYGLLPDPPAHIDPDDTGAIQQWRVDLNRAIADGEITNLDRQRRERHATDRPPDRVAWRVRRLVHRRLHRRNVQEPLGKRCWRRSRARLRAPLACRRGCHRRTDRPL